MAEGYIYIVIKRGVSGSVEEYIFYMYRRPVCGLWMQLTIRRAMCDTDLF